MSDALTNVCFLLDALSVYLLDAGAASSFLLDAIHLCLFNTLNVCFLLDAPNICFLLDAVNACVSLQMQLTWVSCLTQLHLCLGAVGIYGCCCMQLHVDIQPNQPTN